MEQAPKPTPLQQKLELLQSLRKGDLDESHKLLTSLASTSQTHPQMYRMFHSFVSEHKEQIKEMEQEDKQEEVEYIIEDAGSEEDEWETDQEASYGSDQEEQKEAKKAPVVFKNLSNSKSAASLRRPSKDIKRPFYVQTKVKQNPSSSTVNLKKQGTGMISQAELTNITTKLSKTGTLPKAPAKQASKPYFPPIKGAKSTLKLDNK